MIVYLIRNTINGKGYVGQTIFSLEERWKQHLWESNRESKLAIHCAIRKYGKDNFEYCVLEEIDNLTDLNRLEIEQIAKQGTFGKNGYNQTRGGNGTFGYHHSSETKEKIRISNIGWKHSPEAKEKMSNAHKGKKLSLYHRTQSGNGRRGKKRKPFSPEWRANISSGCKGRKNSDECRAKISASNMGRKCSLETRKKIGAANKISNKGKPWSEKRRMAELRRNENTNLVILNNKKTCLP